MAEHDVALVGVAELVVLERAPVVGQEADAVEEVRERDLARVLALGERGQRGGRRGVGAGVTRWRNSTFGREGDAGSSQYRGALR